jgi:UDP-GlcNAc:undecaprenyl-phosphate GlcNAc-1-phosphate transferase
MNSITGYLATYGGAAFIGLCITPLVSQIARVLGVIDAPNHRKVHGSPVPRVGGLAIAIATTLPLLIWAAMLRAGVLKHFHSPSASNIYQLAGLLTGAACVLLVGLLDDIYELPSKYKLLALVAGAAVLCSSGGTIQSIIIGGHDWLDLGIAAWPITMLWIVGVTVSINFIDGLDGLAAGIVLIGALILAVTSATGGYWPGTVLALALAGALSAFLVFNFNPASIFMGDCGSMFIGFLLAGGCVLAGQSVGTTRSIILPAIALSVPLCDTLFTMVRRGVLQRRSLFAAERGHIHHRLLDSGLCHKHVVLLLYLATLAGALVAIVGLVGNAWAAIAIALLFDYGLWGLFRTAGSLRAKETLLAVRRNRALSREGRRYQNAFYDLQLRFREVRNVDQWWKLLCHAGDVLDFGKIDIEMTRRDGSEAALRWRRDDQEIAATTSITAEVPIPQRRTGQTLRAAVEAADIASPCSPASSANSASTASRCRLKPKV